MADFQKAEDNQKPTFDPRAKYTWERDDKFMLTGEEFELLVNALRANLSNPEFLKAAQIWEGIKITDKIIREGVEAGIIKQQSVETIPELTLT